MKKTLKLKLLYQLKILQVTLEYFKTIIRIYTDANVYNTIKAEVIKMADFVIEARKRKEYEQFTCRIEADLLEKIREIVTENNLQSVNEFINECLRFSIENLKIKSDNEGK